MEDLKFMFPGPGFFLPLDFYVQKFVWTLGYLTGLNMSVTALRIFAKTFTPAVFSSSMIGN